MADHRNWFPGDLGFRTIEELYKSRRRKQVLIPEGALLSCLTLSACVPGDVMVKYSLDVPPGTMAVTRHWSCDLQGEIVILVNEDWPEVQPGESPPWLKIDTTPVMVKMDQTRYPDGLTQPFMGKPGITPLRLPFPVPEEKRDQFLEVVSKAVLTSGVLSKEDILAARGFFAAILGVETVQAALEEPACYVPKFLDGSEVEKTRDKDGNVGYKVPHALWSAQQDELRRLAEEPAVDRLAVARAAAQEIVDRHGIVNKDYDHGSQDSINPFDKTWRDRPPQL